MCNKDQKHYCAGNEYKLIKPEDLVKRTVMAMLLFSSAAWAQNKFQPLNVKTGLWESTVTSTRTGQVPIPAELLSRLSPEQRAKFEARMKANSAPKATTVTKKDCETKEKLAEQPFNNQKECKQTIVTSSNTKVEIKVSCEFGDIKANGTMQVEALTPESVKGSGQMASNGGGQSMSMNTSFTAKWLGPTCGSVE
jgi:hypothetical protein